MHTVFVSIGSNIDRQHNIRCGVDSLRSEFGDIEKSSVFESEAEGFAGDPFYNMVVSFQATDPIAVNAILHDIEDRNGRVRGQEKFSSRTLDLDLLLFGSEDLRAKGLDVPRAEITRYAFILWPLSEIAPNLVHPTMHLNMASLWQEFKQQNAQKLDIIKVVDFDWQAVLQ